MYGASHTPKATRYVAFVSYSHVDSRDARWLHGRLEGYRVPRGVSAEGDDPDLKLSPIFRDRDELKAGPSLTESLREALRDSGALIVLCSVDSAKSTWVSQEIQYFADVHGWDRVFAVILNGDPAAREGDPRACYPEALYLEGSRTVDVLAADFRKSGDGRTLGFLKLVSGLLGLPLDRLVRRHEKRSLQRFQMVAALSLVLALVFAGLGIGLYFQWREAVRQRDMARNVRDGAQELNTFIVGDLRTKLRAVGRLDLLEDATKRVLTFHEGLPAELGDDPKMVRARAMALDYRAQTTMSRGDATASIALFSESQAVWKELTMRPNNTGDAWLGYATSFVMLGEAFAAAGNTSAELSTYDEGMRALSGLSGTSPQDGQLLKRARAKLLGVRGDALYRMGRSNDSLNDLDAAAAIALEVLEAEPHEPKNWIAVNEAFKRLAKYYFDVRDLDAALAQTREAVDAAKQLVEMDSDHSDQWSRLASSLGVKLMVHIARDEWSEAETAAREMMGWRTRCFKRDPSNPSAEALLAAAYDDLAFVLSHQGGGQQVEALNHFQSSFSHFSNLLEKYPTRQDWRRGMGLTIKRRGDFAFEMGEWELAEQDYEACVYLRENTVKMNPGDVRLQVELANARIALGEAIWKQGRLNDARAEFEQAREIALSSVSPDDHEGIAEVGRAANEALLAIKREIKKENP